MKQLHPAVQEYIDLVESGAVPVCREQKQLVAQVKRAFETEAIYLDADQLGRYLSNQKYFPYKLLEWEKFIFALHNCAYSAPGVLRWPILFVEVGRGAGKNGCGRGKTCKKGTGKAAGRKERKNGKAGAEAGSFCRVSGQYSFRSVGY